MPFRIVRGDHAGHTTVLVDWPFSPGEEWGLQIRSRDDYWRNASPYFPDKPDVTDEEWRQRLFTLAFKEDGDFDQIEKRIEAAKELSYQEFRTLVEEWLGKANKKRVAILFQGKLPDATSLHYQGVRSPARLKQLSTYSRRSTNPLDIPNEGKPGSN